MSASRRVMAGEYAETFPLCQRQTFRDTENEDADTIPHMAETTPETLQARIEKLIRDLKISVREAERLCELSDGTIRKLLANPDQMPTGRTLQALATGLQTSESYLLTGIDIATPAIPTLQVDRPPIDVRNFGSGSTPQVPYRDEMPNDLPVMGTAAGNHLRGAFKLGSDPVDFVRRPPALTRNKEAYALYVEGSSMEPQFFAGDLIFINPNRPARLGDVVVIQIRDDDGGAEGTLGIYRKHTETSVTIGKRNPVADVEILRKGELVIHKVLNNNELFGL